MIAFFSGEDRNSVNRLPRQPIPMTSQQTRNAFPVRGTHQSLKILLITGKIRVSYSRFRRQQFSMRASNDLQGMSLATEQLWT